MADLQATLAHIMEALNRIESMCDDTDANHAKALGKPQEGSEDMPEGEDSQEGSGVSGEAPSGLPDDSSGDDLESSLNDMADKGDLGAHGALSLFKKDKRKEEE